MTQADLCAVATVYKDTFFNSETRIKAGGRMTPKNL